MNGIASSAKSAWSATASDLTAVAAPIRDVAAILRTLEPLGFRRDGEGALRELAAAGFDPVYGARPLKRAIQAQIENPLAKAILEGKFAAKDKVRVDVNKAGVFTFEKAVLH